MPLIDDEGNLFGAVNVIDALAVLLLLAVAVAGIAVVGVLGSDGEPAERYATIDLGDQPMYVVDRIDAGDQMPIDGYEQNLSVTDVYVSPVSSEESDGDAQVILRARLEGELVEYDDRSAPVFEFSGERLRVGDALEIDTLEYVAGGRVTSLDQDGPDLTIERTPVLLEATVPDRTAEEIREGDAFELGAHTVASVTTVRTYPAGADQHRVLVGAELETLVRGSSLTFGDRQLTIGSQLSLSTDAYDLNGEVIRRGADDAAGDETTTTARLTLENVEPEVAAGLSEGMTETVRGETLATVRSVERRPAEVVLESEDGNIFLREHPKNEDVTLTVELRTRRTDTGLRFHGESIREGDTVTLDLGTTLVQGELTRLETGAE